MTAVTASEDDQPDREQALADIADALGRLRGEPADPVTAEIARLRKDIQDLTAAQAAHHCHCWCHHLTWTSGAYVYPVSTFGAAGGYNPPVTWTSTNTSTAGGSGSITQIN